MSKKVLVFGGTNFFGKRLIQHLIDRGDQVTIVTRGNNPDDFGEAITRIKADRKVKAELEKHLAGSCWDIVFDQICFGPDEAQLTVDLFGDRVKRYVFTSTASVYNDYGENYKESDFDPKSYPLKMGPASDYDYGEAKRLAEAVFFQKAQFSIAAARFPIVVGADDSTGRMAFHIDRIREGKEIFHPNLEAQKTFISSSDAASFLIWLAVEDFDQPVNAHSGVLKISDFIQAVEKGTGKKILLAKEKNDENFSPYGIEKSWFMDNSLSLEKGFKPQTDLLPYIEELSR